MIDTERTTLSKYEDAKKMVEDAGLIVDGSNWNDNNGWLDVHYRKIAHLLAEVERLDAIIRDIESLIPENPDYVCEQILGACHRYMHPEEFGEVIE